jgi:hypothetical protein
VKLRFVTTSPKNFFIAVDEFILLLLMCPQNFDPLSHTKRAIQLPKRLHAANRVPLPQNLELHQPPELII